MSEKMCLMSKCFYLVSLRLGSGAEVMIVFGSRCKKF